ncbi:MAG: hypothetical protein R2861_05085 [Desulfobacterales bacterium]
MLRLQNVNSYYGLIHILKNVSMHVSEGEIVALLRGQRCRQNNHPADHQRFAARG